MKQQNPHNLPFEIEKIKKSFTPNTTYYVSLEPVDMAVKQLKKTLTIEKTGRSSDILLLNIKSSNPNFAQNVINELIQVFNNDGIKDRQSIHKRTIDFVNDRYLYLSLELDSIERRKQTFKHKNKLVDLKTNATLSLEKSSISEEKLLANESQLFVTRSLLESLSKLNYDLLPSNLGVESAEVNSLINTYNINVLEYNKLILSAGPNNPRVKQTLEAIKGQKKNIIFSLQKHLEQLNIIEQNLSIQLGEFDGQVSTMPKNEKTLRSIERKQEVKRGNLFIFNSKKSRSGS